MISSANLLGVGPGRVAVRIVGLETSRLSTPTAIEVLQAVRVRPKEAAVDVLVVVLRRRGRRTFFRHPRPKPRLSSHNRVGAARGRTGSNRSDPSLYAILSRGELLEQARHQPVGERTSPRSCYVSVLPTARGRVCRCRRHLRRRADVACTRPCVRSPRMPCRNGSRKTVLVVHGRQAEERGNLGERHRVGSRAPRSGRTSAARELRIPELHDDQGDEAVLRAPRTTPRPSSRLYALTQRSPSALSFALGERLAAESAGKLGKREATPRRGFTFHVLEARFLVPAGPCACRPS